MRLLFARRPIVRPSKFLDAQARRLVRPLTVEEVAAILAARAFSQDGKRETVKAMWKALRDVAAKSSVG